MSSYHSRAIEGLAIKESNPRRALEIAEAGWREDLEVPRLAPSIELPTAIQLLQIIDLQAVAFLRGTHVASVVREDERRVARGMPSQILHVSDRRRGMRLRHALMLDDDPNFCPGGNKPACSAEGGFEHCVAG